MLPNCLMILIQKEYHSSGPHSMETHPCVTPKRRLTSGVATPESEDRAILNSSIKTVIKY